MEPSSLWRVRWWANTNFPKIGIVEGLSLCSLSISACTAHSLLAPYILAPSTIYLRAALNAESECSGPPFVCGCAHALLVFIVSTRQPKCRYFYVYALSVPGDRGVRKFSRLQLRELRL